MARLTKPQTVIIDQAAKRADGALLPEPEALSATDTALNRALDGLVTKGLATHAGVDDGKAGYVLTDAGRAALVPGGKSATVVAASAPSDAPARPGGKLGAVLKAVEHKRGATLAELTAATGWQSHTTRAALTRLRQRGFPAALTEEGGRKAYRLQS